MDISLGATTLPSAVIISYSSIGDVAKGRNEIPMNQVIQKNGEGGRGWAVGCVLVAQSCSGALSLWGDMYVTMWRLRGEGVLGCIVLAVEKEREKSTSRLS